MKKKNKKPLRKKKKIPDLKPQERLALDVLKNARRGLSTNEVSQYSGMAWSTTKKALLGLRKKRKSIQMEQEGRAMMYKYKR